MTAAGFAETLPPSVPGPLGEAEPVPVGTADEEEARVALALAAAFLVARGLASAWLSRQEPDLTGVLAHQAWDQGGGWLPAATPALRRGYAAGGLTASQADRAATAYAVSLGEHLADTSGQAMLAGFQAQLAVRWPARTAWARAAAGYGLDGPGMTAWIAHLLRGERIPGAARVEDLLMARALRLGETEAFRARNSGKTLGWVWMQATGLLGPDTGKSWRTARDELTCPFCRDLDGQTVGLDEPFRYPDGTEIFCPPSHPNCRCVPELAKLGAAAFALAKALGDEERRARSARARTAARDEHGEFARVETRPGAEPETKPAAYTQPGAAYAGLKPAAYTGTQAAAYTQPAAYTRPAAYTQTEPLTEPQTRAATGAAAYTRTAAYTKPAQQRILLIVPPKRPGLPGGRHPQWMVTRSQLEQNLSSTLPYESLHLLLPPVSGNTVDFDQITLASYTDEDLAALGVQPWEGMHEWPRLPPDELDEVRPRARPVSLDRPTETVVDQPHPLDAHFWSGHEPARVRLEAASLINEISGQLSQHELDELFSISAWDYNQTGSDTPPFSGYSPQAKRQLLVDAVTKRRTAADVGLANAYMDYIAYVQPPGAERSGPLAAKLHREMLDYAGGYRGRRGAMRFDKVPVQEMYVFADGFNSPVSAATMEDEEGPFHPLRGRYQVDHVTYQSTPAVPGIAAIRFVYLRPTERR